MNTVDDRGNRFFIAQARARDLFWMVSIVAASHLMIFVVIGLAWSAAYLPATIWIVFASILTVMGSFDAMDDLKAVFEDATGDERQTNLWKRTETVQWGAFKGLLGIGAAATVLAEIYAMWAI
mgnify:FL=1